MARKTKQQEIDELREKLEKAYSLLRAASEHENTLREEADKNFNLSAEKQRLERERLIYKEKYEMEQRKNERLKAQLEEVKKIIDIMEKNKKAGRKPKNDAWKKQYQKFCELKTAGMSQEHIMQHMQISRATYFRLKKIMKESL